MKRTRHKRVPSVRRRALQIIARKCRNSTNTGYSKRPNCGRWASADAVLPIIPWTRINMVFVLHLLG
jgi:hypothetical protein